MHGIDLSNLTHPITGAPLQPLGIVAGRPVWPILGGSEPAGGGEGGDGGEGGEGGQQFGQSIFQAPASQAELDRIIQDRLSRVQRQYGMTPQEAAEYRQRVEALELDLSSETEKAARAAADEGFNRAMSEAVPRVIRAEFRAAAAAAGMGQQQLDALLEDIDFTRYADDSGEPDVGRIQAKVSAFAPQQREFPDLGGGNRGAGAKPKTMNDLIREKAGVTR